MSSLISRKPLTRYGITCGSTISVQVQFASLSSSRQIQMNSSTRDGSEHKLQLVKDDSITYQLLQQILSDLIEGKHRRRNITKLRFADCIDAQAMEEQELEAMVESLHNPAQGIRWRPS